MPFLIGKYTSDLTLSKTSPGFYVSAVQTFENTMRKGEIALYKQFLHIPRCFLPFWITFCHYYQIQNCRPQTLSVWKSLKFVIWERVKLLTTLLTKMPMVDYLQH